MATSTSPAGSANAARAGRERAGVAAPSGTTVPRRKRSALALVVGAALASAMLSWALSATSPFELLELKTYDLRFVLRGKQAPPSSIILVLLDERTEAAFPEPRIFWHPRFASLLRAAAAGGARAVGLDVSFGISV